jgi:hypothetical protein
MPIHSKNYMSGNCHKNLLRKSTFLQISFLTKKDMDKPAKYDEQLSELVQILRRDHLGKLPKIRLTLQQFLMVA